MFNTTYLATLSSSSCKARQPFRRSGPPPIASTSWYGPDLWFQCGVLSSVLESVSTLSSHLSLSLPTLLHPWSTQVTFEGISSGLICATWPAQWKSANFINFTRLTLLYSPSSSWNLRRLQSFLSFTGPYMDLRILLFLVNFCRPYLNSVSQQDASVLCRGSTSFCLTGCFKQWIYF